MMRIGLTRNALHLLRSCGQFDMATTESQPQPAPAPSAAMVWTGRVLSALPVLLLTMSGVMKVMQPPDLAKGFEHLGWPLGLAWPLAVVELGCVVVYVAPQTAVLGAILITGYLGGAIATHVRIGDAWHMPLLIGVVVWVGLDLREPRLRKVIPLRW